MKNNFEFKLEDFPNDNFEYENNIFSGKATLKQNGIPVDRSNEKGKPFLLKSSTGEVIKAVPKVNYPDISAQALEINGTKHIMANKLKWYEYIIGGLPFFAVLGGGAIGGAIGGATTFVNYAFFRENTTALNKYLKVIGVNLLCVLVYLLIGGLFYKLLHS